MGVASDKWVNHVLPSGRALGDVLHHTLKWLSEEGYIRSPKFQPDAEVRLTQKGLTVLNAIPEGLSATVGSSLVKASSEPAQNWSGIGDLVGGIIGGFTKSVSGS